MEKFLILFFILTLSCSLTEPCSLVIKNNSQYEINVILTNSSTEEVNIAENKGEIVYTAPGEVKINVFIEELKYQKKYTMQISAFEKKKFEFSLN